MMKEKEEAQPAKAAAAEPAQQEQEEEEAEPAAKKVKSNDGSAMPKTPRRRQQRNDKGKEKSAFEFLKIALKKCANGDSIMKLLDTLLNSDDQEQADAIKAMVTRFGENWENEDEVLKGKSIMYKLNYYELRKNTTRSENTDTLLSEIVLAVCEMINGGAETKDGRHVPLVPKGKLFDCTWSFIDEDEDA